MNLRNGNITVAEILSHKPAREYLMSVYPMLTRHPMLHKAHRLSLNTVLRYVGDALSVADRKKLIEKLAEL